MSGRGLAATLGVLALVALLGFGLLAKGGAELEIGEPAPDFSLPALGSEDTGSLADYRGRWVLVNFWASWCDPCRAEAPALEEFHREHAADDFTVLGVDQRDLTDDALAFVDEFELTYPIFRDAEGKLVERFGMSGLPESFLVDPDGALALIHRGPVDEEFLEHWVKPYVREKPPQPAS